MIVVGAGAAGIAAARELRDAGRRVIVLEARDRIGGRVLTQRDTRLGVALELGAEFVHGHAPETLRIAREAGLVLCNVTGESWRSAGGRLRCQHDEWRSVDRVLELLDPQRTPDRSFAEFLASRPGGRGMAAARASALEFVRGYHAADPDRVSERSLARAGPVGGVMSSTMLVVDGYDRVIEWLAVPLGGALRLEALVERVTWAPGSVQIEALTAGPGAGRYQARAAIVTVPISVLRAAPAATARIAFSPELPESTQAAIAALDTGSAVRMTLVLREPLWQDPSLPGLPKGKRLDHMSFLHTRDGEFNVWWTLFPLVERVIVGWCGGPPARALAARGRAAIEDVAITELARCLGLDRDRVEAELESCVHHDWQSDPFSLGVYSYSLRGGADAPARLAEPVDGTLFFAGEATDAEGRTGTVEGAIASGRRAARALLEVLP